MNSLLKTTKEKRSLTEQIFGIIDTKIQYVDYQTKKLVNNLLGEEVNDLEMPAGKLEELFQFDRAHSNCDSFLDRMEEYSRTKRLLLILRSHLCDEHTRLIFSLLSDNMFLSFQEEDLVKLFKSMKPE